MERSISQSLGYEQFEGELLQDSVYVGRTKEDLEFFKKSFSTLETWTSKRVGCHRVTAQVDNDIFQNQVVNELV
jgi:hypothetical protein